MNLDYVFDSVNEKDTFDIRRQKDERGLRKFAFCLSHEDEFPENI